MKSLEFKILSLMIQETREKIKRPKKLTRAEKDAMAVAFFILVRADAIKLKSIIVSEEI
jgi:hypothetical protein